MIFLICGRKKDAEVLYVRTSIRGRPGGPDCQIEVLREGGKERAAGNGTQLAGKTLGIVGLGRIGQAVATRAVAMEMRVIGYDPFVSDARAKELGIQMAASPQELLPLVDILTVHTPLNEQTRTSSAARKSL